MIAISPAACGSGGGAAAADATVHTSENCEGTMLVKAAELAGYCQIVLACRERGKEMWGANW